ncbi:Hexadecenal dehydrogenase [Vanrija albida]|uniref:Aldehyde dehydrogenase n=1 Tax=Vanrija albida TaxID=181172 RepID=A0ABR3QCU8_9TREE
MVALPPFVDTRIDALDQIYDTLQATFLTNKTLDIAYRNYNLKQLYFLLTDNEERIHASLKADLDKAGFDANVGDIWPVVNQIALAIKRLPQWMKPESASKDASLMFKLMSPRVVKQPKGVSLIISAWNYPWQLALGPLVGAIAAGCPAVIKMSEHAPASGALMEELIPRYLDPEAYAVVNGGVDQTTVLLQKQWGHIMYTGSGVVGKIVAGAAAKTLTPTTLELGGKSPVIVAPDADVKIGARRILSMKSLNLGQVCVAPDYILVVKEKVDEFVNAIVETMDEFFPRGSERSFVKDGAYACIRNERDYERIVSTIDEQDAKGQLVYRAEADEKRRRIGINVVKLPKDGAGEQGLLVNDEIFGPILPIMAVDSVEAAIKYVNARPHPLALYVLSKNRSYFDKVIHETLSGSAIWNDVAFTPVATTLPFGGVGDSGWGNYHGVHGFNTFSHHKAILEVPYWLELAQKSRYPPNLDANARKIFKMFMVSKVNFSRPVSVEGEQKLLRSQQNRRTLYIGALLIIIGAWAGIAARQGANAFGSVGGWIKAKLNV